MAPTSGPGFDEAVIRMSPRAAVSSESLTGAQRAAAKMATRTAVGWWPRFLAS